MKLSDSSVIYLRRRIASLWILETVCHWELWGQRGVDVFKAT